MSEEALNLVIVFLLLTVAILNLLVWERQKELKKMHIIVPSPAFFEMGPLNADGSKFVSDIQSLR